MRHTLPLICIVLTWLPSFADAQARTPAADRAVVATYLREPGVLVELIGLDHWTPQMIQDSLAPHGESLTSHACAAVLQGQLGFAEAIAVRSRGDSAVSVLVAVVEPQDSALVTERALGRDTTRSVAPWPALVQLAQRRLRVFQAAVRAHVRARAAGLAPTVSMSARADSADLHQVWAVLDANDVTEDAAAARQVLITSPNVYDRLAAVAILSRFDQQDATWHALVGALLDPEDRVRSLANEVLGLFTSALARPVDWRPAATELRAVLNGSALFALPDVLDMLVATDVEPTLAGPLLRDGGHAVLMYAGAENGWARAPAYRFLRTVSGTAERRTPAAWRRWIAGL